MNLSIQQRLGVLFALCAMMLAIRMSHFGTAHLLPDASLAVFLLGGLLLRRGYFFIILMLLAFGMDVYVARSATDIGCVLSQPISACCRPTVCYG